MDEIEQAPTNTQTAPGHTTHKVVRQQADSTLPTWVKWAVAAGAALVIALIGYSIGRQTVGFGGFSRTGFNTGMVRGGDFSDRMAMGTGSRSHGGVRGTLGEVTAVNAESITIKDTMRGGSVTYKIDSNTKVTENETTKAVSDIKTGNTVRVAATGSDTAVATTILLGTY